MIDPVSAIFAVAVLVVILALVWWVVDD